MIQTILSMFTSSMFYIINIYIHIFFFFSFT